MEENELEKMTKEELIAELRKKKEDRSLWMNKSKSGKGVYMFLPGELVGFGNLDELKKFVEGEKDGFRMNWTEQQEE